MPVELQGGMAVPPLFFYQSDTPVSRDHNGLLTGVGGKVGFVVRVPKTGTLHGFEFAATGGWHVGNTIRIGIWSVDPATGVPTSREIYGDYSGIASDTWVDGCEDMTTQGTGLVAHIAGGQYLDVEAGDLIACVAEHTGVTAGVSMRTILRSSVAFPYGVTHNGSSWTRSPATHTPMLVLRYVDDIDDTTGIVEDETHVVPLGCLAHETERFFTDTEREISAGETKEMTFSLPWDADCGGVQIFMNAVSLAGTPATFTVALKNAAGTTLASCAMSGAYNEDDNRGFAFAAWAPVSLTANTTYTVAITVATGTVAIYERLYEDNNQRSVGPGGEQFAVWDGDELRQLVASLIMVPQSAAAPVVATRPEFCGRAFTATGCETEVPADPEIELDTPGSAGAAQTMAAPALCGRALTPPICDPDVPADPAIVLDDAVEASGNPGFASVLFLFGLANPLVGALTRPTGCTPFVPAYCTAPSS